MSVIQVEDLVSYQLRTSYLNEVADGVGERLFTLNQDFLHSTPFKSAGWRANPALLKRTYSPPIPTAIASEYFQTPKRSGQTLEDEVDEGSLDVDGGDNNTGPSMVNKRRRRGEQMEDDDSSDLSDDSDDDTDQRAAQQIKFEKMPLRHRSGSSPIQPSTLRQVSTASSPQPGGSLRRGSQPTLEPVKERVRRDTVNTMTSSEISSENELDTAAFCRPRESWQTATRASGEPAATPRNEPNVGRKRQESGLLEEEDDESNASDASSNFLGTIDLASILDAVGSSIKLDGEQVVGTPPREFTRRATVRRSALPAPLQLERALPPPRPLSVIRPLSVMQPVSLLTAALKASKTKPNAPFDKFASLSGQGDPSPIRLRIYAPSSSSPSRPFEVLIRRTVHQGEGGDRAVTVADLIGLSLWRFTEEQLEPPLPSDRLKVNWWSLRMVEEDGEVDDDFPPLERTKPLASFATANNKAGRGRSNSRVYDIFALVQASAREHDENKALTPEFEHEEAEEEEAEDLTPKNTPRPQGPALACAAPRLNPLVDSSYRSNVAQYADVPQPAAASTKAVRGQKKLLRIHIMSSDTVPGQMITLEVTTDTWLADVLEMACRKRQLDQANHLLKLPGSGTVVFVDRTVASLGNVDILELHRRRFAADGPLTLTGSPGSSVPRHVGLGIAPGADSWGAKAKATVGRAGARTHPLAKEALKLDEMSAGMSPVPTTYHKYSVWRKQPMRLVTEKLFALDGEYIHIMPASGGKMLEGDGGKTTTVHFSNVVGCKVSRKHPANFKLVVYKATESKRYDFVTRSADEASAIVAQLKQEISPYREV